MDTEIDLRRVAIEAIATLADIKSTMVALLVKPAGIPADIYVPLLTRRDEVGAPTA